MAENKKLPEFETLNALVDYFDEHDMGDHFDSMPLVDFEIDIQSKTHLIALDSAIIEDLEAVAKRDHIESSLLINKWVREKLAEQISS